MKRLPAALPALLATVTVAMLSASTAAENQRDPANPPVTARSAAPAWAYPVNPPDFKLAPDDGTLKNVPGSKAAYTVSQIRDLFTAPDWHPGDHPPMPQIVARGRTPGVQACGSCHRADGPGGPENASLAGLPAAYIVRQMADFRTGLRKTSVPERNPPKLMIALAEAATAADIDAAAAYFSALKPRSVTKVVETDVVPKTFVFGWHLADSKSGEKEPIGRRIIEVPENLEHFALRDSRARFIAYVPVGSVKKGEILVNTGAGKTLQCATCHGPDLKGLGDVPRIAGMSPSYVVRQLYDIQSGARTGPAAQPMNDTVAKLTLDDMVSIAAYLASRDP